jgi:hypothetical protein
MRFVVPDRSRLPSQAMRCIYLCGMEGIPWRSNCRWIDAATDEQRGTFVVERRIEESGNLYCPWEVKGFGELVLATASLMERERPYHLPVELARGVLNRLRNQASEWQMLGLQVTHEFESLVREAARVFVTAVTGGTDVAAAGQNADQVILLTLQAGEILADEYSQQALAVRHQQTPQLPTLLGACLDSQVVVDAVEQQLLDATNAASVSIGWRELEQVAGKIEWEAYDRQIEWCRNHGLRIVSGPLLQLTTGSVPDWLYLWDEDFQQVQAYLSQFISSVVARYRGRVQIWNCAAGMNVRGSLSLSEEQKLRLVVSAIDDVRSGDPQTPLIVTFDQPWAEYLAFEDLDLSPLHFADSLVRAELSIAGIGLEINLGYWPGGTLPRHRLEISRMLDRWSMLGLPLLVYLSAPSGTDAKNETSHRPLLKFTDGPSTEHQRQWAEGFLPIFLAKPFVQGIFWNQFSDDKTPGLPHGGLFDKSQNAKPVVEVFSAIKHEHLM